MEPTRESLAELSAKVLQDSDLSPADIPALDLYMDQIITLFEGRLAGNKRRPDDKLLTKTMINNYSKEGLLREIKGKKYTKDHIIQILMIYSLKQTLSIQDIKAVLAATDGDEQLAALYSRFLGLKEGLRGEIPALLEGLAGDRAFEGLDDTHRRLLLVLTLSAAGNYMKRLSEEIIDGWL